MGDHDVGMAVRFYRSKSGKEPVRDWLRGLPRQSKKAIGEDIKTVQFGWPLGMPLVRTLGPLLWEVWSAVPEGIARTVFTVDGTCLVLLHAFIKKSQKTPQAELEVAKARQKAYLESAI